MSLGPADITQASIDRAQVSPGLYGPGFPAKLPAQRQGLLVIAFGLLQSSLGLTDIAQSVIADRKALLGLNGFVFLIELSVQLQGLLVIVPCLLQSVFFPVDAA